MQKKLISNGILIVAGLVLILIANSWQDENTSLDIVLAAIGGIFIGGAIVLIKRKL